MAIKLRVISEQYRDLGANRSRVFGVNGGTVGRAPDNDWVLPDPKRVVSGHHFEVQYHGGGFWLRDTSTNGVFVNDSDDPASDQGRVELRDGDRLRMGDYEILVSVDARIDFLPAAGEEDSAAQAHGFGHRAQPRPRQPAEAARSGPVRLDLVRNAYGVRIGTGDTPVVARSPAIARPSEAAPVDRRQPTPRASYSMAAAPQQASGCGRRTSRNPDWALRTRPISTRRPGRRARAAPEPDRGPRAQRPISSAGVHRGRTWARPCRRSVAAPASRWRPSRPKRRRCCR